MISQFESTGWAMKKFAFALTLIAACVSASAETTGGYMGLGYGATSFKLDCGSAPNCAKNDSGPKAFVGININAATALEVAYMNFGRATLSGPGYQVQAQTSALVADAAFRYSFIPEFGAVLRLGLAKVSVKGTGDADVSGYHIARSESTTKAYWGMGLEYKLNNNMKLYGAADFVRAEAIRNEMYSVGAQVGF